jgi:hypothetical protein
MLFYEAQLSLVLVTKYFQLNYLTVQLLYTLLKVRLHFCPTFSPSSPRSPFYSDYPTITVKALRSSPMRVACIGLFDL